MSKHIICERMRRIAVARGLSCQELARRSGLSPGNVWNILYGETYTPWYSTVCKLVAALDAGEISIIEQRQREPNVYKMRRRA